MAVAPAQLWIDLVDPTTIVGASPGAGTATVTISAAHGLVPGDYVQINGVTSKTGFNGVFQIQTTPASTTFTILTSQTGTTTSSDISNAVVSRDLYNPLGNYSPTYKTSALVIPLSSVSLSKSGDGSGGSFGFVVIQDASPTTPWFVPIPDNSRVRLVDKSTGGTPASTESDVLFKGIIASVQSGLNGSGLGSIAQIECDDVNVILDKLTIVGTPTLRSVNTFDHDVNGASGYGIVRTGGSVTVTTESSHIYAAGQTAVVSGAIGGNGSALSNRNIIISTITDSSFTGAMAGTATSQNSTLTMGSVAFRTANMKEVRVSTLQATGITSQMLNSTEFTFSNVSVGTSVNHSAINDWMNNNTFTAAATSTLGNKHYIYRTAGDDRPAATVGTTYAELAAISGVVYTNPTVDLTVPQSANDLTLAASLTEGSAVATVLTRGLNTLVKGDKVLQRLIDTSDTTGITDTGSKVSFATVISPGSLQSAIDSIVEAYSGTDGIERRYWLGPNKKFYYLKKSTPSSATAPLRIVVDSSGDPYANPGSINPRSLQVNYAHDGVIKKVRVIPKSVIAKENGIRKYTKYQTARSGPLLEATIDAPNASTSALIDVAAKAFFVENYKPILSGQLVIRGYGTASYNQYGFSGGYNEAGSLVTSWDVNQWVRITSQSLNLSGLYRVEAVDVEYEDDSFFQKITVSFARKQQDGLAAKLKRGKK
jgi:hypothetical protein